MLRDAVDTVLTSFAKHTGKIGEINAKETLSEFWGEKSNQAECQFDLRYESERLQDGSFVCFVTLPGGSCFGSFEECRTKSEAQNNAAKIALVHSLFNDHSSRIITEKFIEEAVAEAKKSSGDYDDDAGIEAFRYMLSENLGKTMLEYQEMMAVFSLLQWNGNLQSMIRNKMRRKDVVAQFSHKTINSTFREEIADSWLKREDENPGIITKELESIEKDLQKFRHGGQELRFYKEKRDIIMFAINALLLNGRVKSV